MQWCQTDRDKKYHWSVGQIATFVYSLLFVEHMLKISSNQSLFYLHMFVLFSMHFFVHYFHLLSCKLVVYCFCSSIPAFG